MREPKFSVIIPAHQAEDRINIVLDSIKKQTCKDYECIVVCDKCTDATAEIAKQYGFIVDEQNFGNDGLSRSRGIDLARGEWILFLDDDDWFLHEFVLEQLASKTINANFDILAFSFIWKGMKYASPLSNAGFFYPAVWNKMWRRSFIGGTRFPNVYPDSDAYFWSEMWKKGPKMAIWDMPLYYYNYLRVGSISEQLGRSIDSAKNYWEGQNVQRE